MKLLRLAAGCAVVAAVSAGSTGAQLPVALDARVVDISPPVSTASYPTLDYGKSRKATDDRQGQTTWRVVNETGNCCENYLTIAKGGRLLDFGGRYVNFSDDRGLSWKSVRPLEPLVNGEGAIVMAPGGDVLGIEWDPYSGDHLLAFKYESASGKWLYKEMPLHTPFYDREWLAVVPGPFTIEGRSVPYLSFVKGGWPSKELWLYSEDGLTYTEVSSKFVDRTLAGFREDWLSTAAAAELDWVQPNTNGMMTPLGLGDLLAGPDYPTSAWSRFEGDELTWNGFRFPGGFVPEGLFQVDSAGRVHNVVAQGSQFTYRMSSDGGRSWRLVEVPLPASHAIEEIDFRANRAAGVAAVAIRSQDNTAGKDRDLVYKLDIGGKQPRLLRRYQVGLADVNATGGVGNDIRFDFETVAVFADGRIAVSFLDSTTKSTSPTTGAERTSPAVAIEGDTALGERVPAPPDEAVGAAQAPIEGSVIVLASGAGVRVPGVTSTFFEFDSLAGADNARMVIEATPSAPADIDLYFQRQFPDGTWSGDLGSGTSGALDHETIETGALAAGHYRLEVHNWAGLPLEVRLLFTFYNSAGEAGT